MTSPRRRFLSWLGSASLVGIATRPSVLRAEAMLSDRTDNRHAPPATGAWDMGWTAHVTGKYKAVSDSPEELRDQRGKKWLTTNPLAAAADGEPADTVKNTIPAFIAAGGIVLGCGWSFGGAVATIRKVEQLDEAGAEARAKSMLLPGVILQPNGIFAALRAQEAGCSYILAS